MPARRSWQPGRWWFGLALLAAVILVAAHWTEQREFALLLRRAAPEWLLLAALLQAATYLSQAAVWEVVLVRARARTPLWGLYRMSFAKLFIDQALPSAGISGSLLIVRGLERRGIERGPAMASVVVETITNYTALILGLLLALGMATWLGEARAAVWSVSAVFIALASALIFALMRLSRGGPARPPRAVARIPGLRTLIQALTEAPPALAHRPRVLAEATGFNFAIIVLDAATLWTLLRALGVDAAPGGVFTALTLSTVARTLSIVPAGLGIFEAASIAALNLLGVPLAAALSATVLFRGFSLFLPLIPGLLLSRGELSGQREAARPPAVERYWALPLQALLDALGTSPDGLSGGEAARRLERYGDNELEESRTPSRLIIAWQQVKSPLVLLLLVAAVISAFTGAGPMRPSS